MGQMQPVEPMLGSHRDSSHLEQDTAMLGTSPPIPLPFTCHLMVTCTPLWQGSTSVTLPPMF